MCDEHIDELVAAAPELVVINFRRKIVGSLRNKQLKAAYNKLARDCDRITDDGYDIIRQWALDRYFSFPLSRDRSISSYW
jgi:hypothetical protein